MSRLSEFLRLTRKRDDLQNNLEDLFSQRIIDRWNRRNEFIAWYNNSVTIQGYAMKWDNYWTSYEEDMN